MMKEVEMSEWSQHDTKCLLAIFLLGLSQIQPKKNPMSYTDPLHCFIIKAVALGLQTLCPFSVCCLSEEVLILDPIFPYSMSYLRAASHTSTQHLQYKYENHCRLCSILRL